MTERSANRDLNDLKENKSLPNRCHHYGQFSKSQSDNEQSGFAAVIVALAIGRIRYRHIYGRTRRGARANPVPCILQPCLPEAVSLHAYIATYARNETNIQANWVAAEAMGFRDMLPCLCTISGHLYLQTLCRQWHAQPPTPVIKKDRYMLHRSGKSRLRYTLPRIAIIPSAKQRVLLPGYIPCT